MCIRDRCVALSIPLSGCQRSEQAGKDSEEEVQNQKDSSLGGAEKPQTAKDNKEQNTEKKERYLVPVAKNNGFSQLYGYEDQSGKMVIEPKFKTAEPFYACGIAVVSEDTDKYGLIDKKGKYLVEPKYSSFSYSDGLFLTYDYETNKSHAFDEKGKKAFEIDGYINQFSDGLSSYYTDTQKGYLDKTGALVLQPGYSVMNPFVDGIAEVAEQFGSPSFYIDTKGNDLTDKVSSGLRMFQDTGSQLYGYQDANGNVVIEAKFKEARPFLNGYAIVSQAPNAESDARYGIIDTSGKFVLEPKYCGIKRMRNGLYAVGSEGKAEDFLPYGYFDYTLKALYTADLKDHTDWVYYTVEDLDKDTVLVNDESAISFINKSMKPAKSLPLFKGQGILTLDGDYLRGDINAQKVVADKKGNILVRCDERVDLGDGLEAMNKIESPYRTYSMAYPVLSGLKDKAVQDQINAYLYDEMVSGYRQNFENPDPIYLNVFKSNYTISKEKKLILIDQQIDVYALGAAHGSHFRNTVYVDSESGAVYTLKDLLKPGDEGYAKLSQIVSDKMRATMEDVGYWEDHTTITDANFFVLTEKGIVIYFGEYEIASYAAGMPEFLIPYDDIKDYINTDGDFWKSFH
ncbi:MAG: WG repeat-containing protein, partial [Clostridia bacterium]|nr:WG repeat-containing protein [Clostridia bacterium]